jgi:hypothetical protein
MSAAAKVLAEIRAERGRQQSEEGWTTAHDDAHGDGSLAKAAASYAYAAALPERIRRFVTGIYSLSNDGTLSVLWPWAASWWKPKDPRRDLIRAGALIVAEIERLDRAAAAAGATREAAR